MARTRVLLVVAFLVAAILPIPASADAAQPVDWSQSSAGGPSARAGAAMAFDSHRGRTVVFGGGDVSNNTHGDTWEWDGANWTQALPAVAPGARAFGSLAYDSGRSVSVLFGGWSGSAFLNDTWEWDGTAWTQRFPTAVPTPRVWFGMAYDSTRHVTVLFGGESSPGFSASADTWEFDGSTWVQRSLPHSPSGRIGDALAYDAATASVILFGGRDANGNRLNDTWSYDGTDWTQITTAAAPSPRFFHSLAYDSARQRVVTFGGDQLDYSSLAAPLGPTDDTWEFDGSNWARDYPTTWPPRRAQASAAYDSARGQVVLFGGTDEAGAPDHLFSDTWLLSAVINAPGAGLSTDSVNFAQQPVLTTATRAITLVNSGSAPTEIYSMSTTGDFSSSDTCPRSPSTLAVGQACTITISFTPHVAVRQTAQLTVTDNADTGTQSVTLNGSGSYGYLQASPASLSFVPTAANTTASQTVTLTAPAQPTVITGFDAAPPYAVTNLSCPLASPMSYGQSCQLRVDFTPTAQGTFSSSVVVHDSEPGLQRAIPVSGEGSNNPATATFVVTPTGGNTAPQFSDTIDVTAQISAASGTATFTFAGHPLAPVVYTDHAASIDLTLDDSLVPSGAGTYPLTLLIQSTDPAVGNGSAAGQIAVSPDDGQLTWTGSDAPVTGAGTSLAVTVRQPGTEAQAFDYNDHAVYARFDVTDPSGATTSYLARVAATTTSGMGTVVVSGPPAATGAYLVRVTLVSSPGASTASPYLAAPVLYSAFSAHPATGGYMSGGGTVAGERAGFEFEPGQQPTGTLRWISTGHYVTPDGTSHSAWFIATASSVSSVDSHSHTATATGSVAVTVRDSATDAVLGTTSAGFEVDVDVSGATSYVLSDGTMSAVGSFAPGSAINHL